MAKQTVQDVPFTQIANVVLNDKTLSMKAKGLYAYLFSKPESWDFSSARIKEDFTDGRDAILGALRELVITKYLIRIRQPTGRVDYHLVYSQSRESQLGVSDPKSGNPTVGKSLRGKTRPISNKDNHIVIKKDNNKEYSWVASQEKMMATEGSINDIIATFLVEKKLEPKTPAELTGYIKRYARIAKDIQPFVVSDYKKLWKAFDMCKEESYRLNYEWNLETVYKKITKI